MAKPKRIITPEHFKVAPEVLGLPLASPSRRAFAMAIDLLLIVILTKTGGVVLGFAAALVLFRASARSERGGFIKQSARFGLRVTGAFILFAVIVSSWGKLSRRGDDDDREQTTERVEGADELKLDLAPGDFAALAGSLLTLRRANDSAEVKAAATRVLQAAQKTDASADEMYEARSALIEMMNDEDMDSSDLRAVDAALLEVVGPLTPPADPHPRVSQLYLSALEGKDTAAARIYEDSLKLLIAGPELRELERDKTRFRAERDSLRKEIAAVREARGIRSFVAGAADDLGVGFGWSAIFFTAFLALWRGQTPGKRAARVRVLRLDGKPLGWWISFERFGGYAASFSVGLLGFVQILWDRNRQGLHDKACETVVVNDSDKARAIS